MDLLMKGISMKPILHSVSYAGLWGQEQLTLEEFIPHAARLGYAGVMLMTKRPHLSPLTYDDKRLNRLAELLDEYHLSVDCLAGYCDPNAGFSNTSAPFAPLPEMQLVTLRQWLHFAARLKSPLIRLLTGAAGTGEPYQTQWKRCVRFMREACTMAADFNVTIGLQNHDDIGGHYLSMLDLIEEIDRPNCKACLDAWSIALQDADLTDAVRQLKDYIVHTTVADYVKRPRYRYHHPGQGNVYERILDEVKAVPPGEGLIDYGTFFNELQAVGYDGAVAFEMCSPLRGGGSRENLDTYAQTFLKFLQPWM
jgi:sugar phosphate isomerase/epimerase